MTEPTMLGRVVGEDEYGQIETFEVAYPTTIHFISKELEALCPAVAGVQPDIYEMTIQYRAITHAIESKSLKLFLHTFRDRRIFAEHLAQEIYDHLDKVEGVQIYSVRLEQNVRGGIVTVVEVAQC
jgi:7-cyano-7-deazaguanine reductase